MWRALKTWEQDRRSWGENVSERRLCSCHPLQHWKSSTVPPVYNCVQYAKLDPRRSSGLSLSRSKQSSPQAGWLRPPTFALPVLCAPQEQLVEHLAGVPGPGGLLGQLRASVAPAGAAGLCEVSLSDLSESARLRSILCCPCGCALAPALRGGALSRAPARAACAVGLPFWCLRQSMQPAPSCPERLWHGAVNVRAPRSAPCSPPASPPPPPRWPWPAAPPAAQSCAWWPPFGRGSAGRRRAALFGVISSLMAYQSPVHLVTHKVCGHRAWRGSSCGWLPSGAPPAPGPALCGNALHSGSWHSGRAGPLWAGTRAQPAKQELQGRHQQLQCLGSRNSSMGRDTGSCTSAWMGAP